MEENLSKGFLAYFPSHFLRCQWKNEGILRKHRIVKNRNRDSALYVMFNSEWITSSVSIKKYIGLDWKPKSVKVADIQSSKEAIPSPVVPIPNIAKVADIQDDKEVITTPVIPTPPPSSLKPTLPEKVPEVVEIVKSLESAVVVVPPPSPSPFPAEITPSVSLLDSIVSEQLVPPGSPPILPSEKITSSSHPKPSKKVEKSKKKKQHRPENKVVVAPLTNSIEVKPEPEPETESDDEDDDIRPVTTSSHTLPKMKESHRLNQPFVIQEDSEKIDLSDPKLYAEDGQFELPVEWKVVERKNKITKGK